MVATLINWATVVAYFLLALTGSYFDSIIKKYLDEKPLGMQTLFDRVIVLFLGVHVTSGFFGFFLLGVAFEILTPLDEPWLSLITYANTFVTLLFLSVTFLVLGTRYLSIFLSYLIAQSNENKVIPIMTMSTLYTCFLLTLTEFLYLTNVQETFIYHRLSVSGSKDLMELFAQEGTVVSSEKMMVALIGLNLSMMALLQYRIEVDRHGSCFGRIWKCFRKVNPSNAEDHHVGPIDNNESQGYNVNTTRIFLFISALVASPVILGLWYGLVISVRIMYLLCCVCVFVILPLLMILKHSGIKGHLVNSLRKLRQFQ